MSTFHLVCLLPAFLAPVPPPRPEPPRPLPGSAWGAAVVMGSVCVMMVLPMITIWGFHRPRETFRAQCEAAGGHLAQGRYDTVGSLRCEPGAPPAH